MTEAATQDALKKARAGSILSVTVGNASVAAGASVQMVVSVSAKGPIDRSVAWTASDGAIDAAGVYTAPSTAGSYTVTATSVADPTKSSTATVTVTPAVIAPPAVPAPTPAPAPSASIVSVSVANSTVTTGGTVQMTATVVTSGTIDQTVTWSLGAGAAGSIDASTGLYIAPSTAGSYAVVATSVADPTKSGSGTVTVQPAPAPAPAPAVAVLVSPATASVLTGGTVQLTATVTGSTNTAVTWKVQEGTTGGAVSSNGVYTAPSTAGSYHVVATSAADATKSATSTITVTAPAPAPAPPSSGPVLAFPGAEGAGAIAVGGRGGTVIPVTNLNDSGTGSLRACMEASGARTCVFRVSGVITLTSVISISSPYLTVAGQTAPGSGITVTYDTATCAAQGSSCQGVVWISPNAHDVVVRYIRFRHLAPSSSQGGYNVTVEGSKTIFDHCSFSWSPNDDFEINGGPSNVTLSWSVVGDGMAGHNTPAMLNPEGASNLANATDWDIHHTYLEGTHRIPKLGNKQARIENNIIHPLFTYTDVRCATNPFTGGTYDYIGNVFKQGPNGPICEILPASESLSSTYRFYPGVPSLFVSQNVGPSDPSGTNNAALLYKVDPNDDDEHPQIPLAPATSSNYIARSSPNAALTAPITVYSPGSGGSSLATTLWTTGHPLYGPIGASRRLDCSGNWVAARDLFDQGVQVRFQNNSIFGPSSELDSAYAQSNRMVNGVATTWPNVLAQLNANLGSACADSDGDGIPDAYEIAKCGSATCLPGSATAANGYTNLENYLNGQ
jgi:hypothetical protein